MKKAIRFIAFVVIVNQMERENRALVVSFTLIAAVNALVTVLGLVYHALGSVAEIAHGFNPPNIR